MASEEKFMLVLFVDDIGPQKSIDIVPAKWVVYDETKDHLVTPFISNCSKTNLRILKDLVQSEGEPMQAWDLYRISVRGSATSYIEAEKKIKELSTQSFVFTTDTEEHAKERERQITKSYKAKSNHYKKKNVNDLLAASAFNVHDEKSPSTSTSAEPEKRDASNKKINRSKKKSVASKGSRYMPPSSICRPHNGATKKDLQPRSQVVRSKKHSYSDSDTPEEKDCTQSIEELDHRSSDSMFADIENTQSKTPFLPESLTAVPVRTDSNNNNDRGLTPQRGIRANAPSKDKSSKATSEGKEMDVRSRPRNVETFTTSTGALDVEELDDNRTVIMKCYHRLSAQIGQLQAQLTDMKLRQTEMIANNSEHSTQRVEKTLGIDSTMEKYGLGELPFKTLKEFTDFDDQLKTNKSVRKEITHGMTALVNADAKYLTKSTRDVIQRFMTRDTLLNFTAVRQSGTKIILKTDTTFYICMRDAILSKCDTTVIEKNIHDAIGTVINNAKDWDGHRQIRKKTECESDGGRNGGSKKA